jgi:hypothetical protein
MRKHTNWIFITLILISSIVLILFAIPNSKASGNIAKISMFEPDEGITIPVIQKMISPKESLKQFVYYFFAYQYYFYGFPHFGSSAFVLLILQWFNQAQNLSLVMLSLRQIISVLPMLLALLILVYMQDRFKTYRSIVLFVLLLAVPGLVQNGFWWHPDGLVLLLSTLVIYFLWRDDRKFGLSFFLAAAVCGVLIATKLVGAYFFLAVGMTVIWGIFKKEISWKKAILKSIAFIVIMFVSFVISNPFLLLKGDRTLYFDIVQKQTLLLSEGYGIIYEKGLKGAWPLMHQYYGEAIFLITAIGVTMWGIWKKETRFLHALILTWFIPLTLSLLYFSHFKYQYWLPVAIPLFSNLVLLLPANKQEWGSKRIQQIIRILLLAIVGIQMVLFVKQSTQLFIDRTNREKDNKEIAFYNRAMEQLEPIAPDPVYAYYDYRLYLPETENWVAETSFDLLDYEFINSRDFDVLMLSHQRILDYLNPSATGIDPEAFAQNQAFYRDANEGKIEGYHLLFRNETALLYIRDDFCQVYFDPATCQ